MTQRGNAPQPSAEQATVSASPDLRGLPMFGPIAGMMGFDGMPRLEAAAPDAQARYEAALEQARLTLHPDMPPDKWAEYAATALGPYNATQLSQHGALFGASDELGAGIGSLGAGVQRLTGQGGPGIGKAYSVLEELERARRDLGRQQQGLIGTGAEVLGGIASGGAAAKGAQAIGQAGNGVMQTLKGMAGAGTSGAAYGFGATDGDLGDRGTGAALGGALGVAGSVAAPLLTRAVGGIGRGIARRGAVRRAVQAAPSAKTIKADSKAAYRAMEGTGAVIGVPSVKGLQTRLRQYAMDEGLIFPSGKVSTAYPKVADALEAIKEFSAGPLGMKPAQTLHKHLRRVAKSTDPEEARIGMEMLGQFEDWMDNTLGAMGSGAGAEASKQWAKGKTEWARFKRTQTIETALENAQLAKGGFAEGLRSQFRTILKSEKKRRGFSVDDLTAMRRFVDGGPIEAAMEWLARGRGVAGGIAGGITGGPLGAFGTMAAGAAAKGGLNLGARQTGAQLRASVASGGVPQLPALPGQTGLAGMFGGRAANPLLDDERNSLLPMFVGGR